MNEEARKKFHEEIKNLATNPENSIKEDWKDFYRRLFNLQVNFDDIKVGVPAKDKYSLIISKDVNMEDSLFVLDSFYQNRTFCQIEENLDEEIISDRSYQSYFIEVPRARVHGRKIVLSRMTLLERMILELKYPGNDYMETIAVCKGSSLNRDEVFFPVVYRHDCMMFVVDCFPIKAIKEMGRIAPRRQTFSVWPKWPVTEIVN